MQRTEMRLAKVIVGTAGADMECIGEDGEVKFILGLSPGIHLLEKYMDLVGVDDEIRFDGTAAVRFQGGRTQIQSFGPLAFQSGANPNFQPTVYSEAEVRMRKLVEAANNTEARVEKRLKELQRVTSRTTPEQDIDPVVEDLESQSEVDPEPQPSPDPSE